MYFYFCIISLGHACLFQHVDLPFHRSLSPSLPLSLSLSLSLSHHSSLYACLQDRGVISSGAYQPPRGNCLHVLNLQQGSLRPRRVLPAPTPVQEDVH